MKISYVKTYGTAICASLLLVFASTDLINQWKLGNIETIDFLIKFLYRVIPYAYIVINTSYKVVLLDDSIKNSQDSELR